MDSASYRGGMTMPLLVKPSLWTAGTVTPINGTKIFLPMNSTEAQMMWNTLVSNFKGKELQLSELGPSLCVHFVNSEGFKMNLGGWEVLYDQPEGGEKSYTAKYLHKGTEVWITEGAIYFSGPRVGNYLSGLVTSWSEEMSRIRKEHLAVPFIDPAGTCKDSYHPVLFTGEIIEYLWQEGYQFDDYLGGSYLPDADDGSLVIQMFQKGLDEQKFLKRARLWYLAGLAEKNLQEIIKVDLQMKYTYDNRDSEFPFLLGKICENIIDNLGLCGIDDYALRWTSIFENVPVKDEDDDKVNALLKNKLDALGMTL